VSELSLIALLVTSCQTQIDSRRGDAGIYLLFSLPFCFLSFSKVPLEDVGRKAKTKLMTTQRN
jgi:hypothetical protein